MEIIVFDKTHFYNTLEIGINVPVVLKRGSDEAAFEAKVDTGATHCIFERKHAERLGINVESGTLERFGTVTGGFITYGHEMTLSVLDIETYSTVYFAAEESFNKNVLGQTGWLDHVKLGLIDYEGKLFLASNNE
jgi:hypothetical protein